MGFRASRRIPRPDGGRVKLAGLLCFLDVDGAGGKIHVNDAAEFLAPLFALVFRFSFYITLGWFRAFGLFRCGSFGGRHADVNVATCADFCVLFVEGVAIDRDFVLDPCAFHEFQPAETRAVFEQFVVVEFLKPISLPPGGFVLAAVPVDEIRQHPGRGLLARALFRLQRNPRFKLFHERGDAFLLLVQLLSRSAITQRWTRDRGTGSNRGGALGFEPVA